MQDVNFILNKTKKLVNYYYFKQILLFFNDKLIVVKKKLHEYSIQLI